MTNTGIRYRTHKDKEKLLPCLTLYALPAYRHHGFYYTEAMFVNNTFNIEDIFDKETLRDLKNNSLFHVIETYSLFYGRCFTICYLKQATNNSNTSTYFSNRTVNTKYELNIVQLVVQVEM